MFGDIIIPDKPPSRQAGNCHFWRRRSFADLRTTPATGLTPEGERMSFCDQMAAAIDGARTLTRLDHLSRSIWQGLAAGAVADDDAQSLAERLHACRAVLRGEIKPVGLPMGRPSIFPPKRRQREPQRPVAIAR